MGLGTLCPVKLRAAVLTGVILVLLYSFGEELFSLRGGDKLSMLTEPPPKFDFASRKWPPSCLFAGEDDGSAGCKARESRIAGHHSPVSCLLLGNTRKYNASCHGLVEGRRLVDYRDGSRVKKPALLDLLVTGVGGSGTNMVGSALGEVGVTVGHECIKGSGAASWIHAVNDAVVGAKYPFPRKGPLRTKAILDEKWPRFRKVVHQVRCPVANMAALTTHNNFSREFIWRAAGVDPTLPGCLWGANVWYQWNKHVETYADVRIRIEDFDSPEDMARRVCEIGSGLQTGVKCRSAAAQKALTLAKAGLAIESGVKGHHREHGSCSFAQVHKADPGLAKNILEMASRYGYLSSKKCDLSTE
mmetsp:Transcript_68834/g.155701  ORF Transcript_68834/g.155701 Transcript_68834/m.155701 type:complete len:359 (+) Transcript_68834:188-1264(+)